MLQVALNVHDGRTVGYRNTHNYTDSHVTIFVHIKKKTKHLPSQQSMVKQQTTKPGLIFLSDPRVWFHPLSMVYIYICIYIYIYMYIYMNHSQSKQGSMWSKRLAKHPILKVTQWLPINLWRLLPLAVLSTFADIAKFHAAFYASAKRRAQKNKTQIKHGKQHNKNKRRTRKLCKILLTLNNYQHIPVGLNHKEECKQLYLKNEF